MDIKEIKSILKKYGMKLTSPRSKVLEAFYLSDRAVTYCEILEFAAKTIDRVTIYRTLKSFEDIGLIHRIVGASEAPAYALSVGSAQQLEFKQHLHFGCTKCQGVFCLNDYGMPSVSLPEPFRVHSMSLIITGLCRSCNLSADDPH
jgi:Fur family ferric uptake transcriptional regulator